MDKKSLSHEWNNPDGIKAVKIKLNGHTKMVINWASLNEGDLIFNSDLSGRRKMYVISEVVHASKTSIMIRVDGSKREEKISL